MKRVLIDLPRWLFLVALVEAPWLYGTTRPWTITVFNWLIGSVIVLWLGSALARRRKPVVHPGLLLPSLFLIAQGWFMIANAKFYYDWASLRFVPVECFWRAGPGAVDTVEAIPAMITFTGLLAIPAFVCDLLQRREWRLRVWWTIALAGASLMIFGIAREAMGLKLRSIYSGEPGPTSFAGYYYHANAGAFINLVLPLAVGLAVLAFRSRGHHLQRAIWPPAVMLCLAGAVIAASKAAMVICVLLLIVLLAWQLPKFTRSAERPKSHLAWWILGVAFGIFAAASIGWETARQQWSQFFLSGDDSRFLVYQAAVTMLPDAGAWGIGPGNFILAFPHYTMFLGNRIEGFWDTPHNDYLQTVIEWGWIGGAFWSILLFGALALGACNYLRFRRVLARADRIFLFTSMLALAGVAAHALVDFPLQIPSLQLYAALNIGICWGSSYWGRERVSRATC